MELLTVREVAEHLKCTPRHVRNLIARNELPIVHIGKRAIRVASSDLQAWLEDNRSGTTRILA